MRIKKIKDAYKIIMLLTLLGSVIGCVEPIEIETGTYENALVIEGTITNELSHQEILLSRTYPLEESGPSLERNADVRVVSSSNVYQFSEVEPGRYSSVQPFKAVQGEQYILEITTSNGDEYSSEPEELPQGSTISSLYAEKLNFEGETGVAILVDVTGPEATSGYYRYDYSETYKIVSPFKFNLDARVVNGEFVEFPKTKEETICYVTEESQEIFLANTNVQAGSDLDAFLIKFMEFSHFKTAHRYSILVRQFSISEESYSYYQTLKDFSDSESLFTQNQLGLINGNVFSVSDPGEPVVGIFTVARVSSERIFFDFEDFYGDLDFGIDAHVKCEVLYPPTSTVNDREAIGGQLENGSLKYLGFEMGVGYRFIKTGCVDCTVFGSNVPPDFWQEK
ncbi:DUF4249 domain-containing protein [Salinimicrobium sp. HB62]|uniref:DUF4249 domain-containing protein n=1 Tax=Salinimicrobium sp. HB62 TaxID=3077781 RepID=UPI002D796884|nr:DUF4249 domain-containing protein [Salinimicrobium sp. HB62]